MNVNVTPTKMNNNLKSSIHLIEGVLPFTEKPSNKYFEQKEETNINDVHACELFSLFTADIIKEEVVFTR
jgi:hypothetical protein